MKIKSYTHLIALGIGFVATVLAYIWFIHTPYFDELTAWSHAHREVFFVLLVIIKIFGIIWPPVPGGLFTLGSIPILGWQVSFAADFMGNMIGSSLAYVIGKRWGYAFLEKIFDQGTIARVQKIRVAKGREIEAVFVLRLLTGSLLMEAFSYGAGLVGVGYASFIVGSALSHLIVGIPAYFLASNVIHGENFAFNILGILLAIPLFLILKKRYLQ